MELAIVLSLAASICTATSSICQRLGARELASDEGGAAPPGFDALLVFRLARQPTWLLGFGCMIAGFAFQVSALHFGPLALVQPILAVELLLVFGYLALRAGQSRAHWRDWWWCAWPSRPPGPTSPRRETGWRRSSRSAGAEAGRSCTWAGRRVR